MAAALKDEGNKLFQAGDCKKAAECYTRGIAMLLADPTLSHDVAKTGRGAARKSGTVLPQTEHVQQRGGVGWRLPFAESTPGYRRALALEKLGEIKSAVLDFKQLLRTEPQHADALAALSRLDASSRSNERKQSPSASQHGSLWSQPGASAWAAGLSPQKQQEWLVDACGRYYAWGGCNLPGLYDPDHTAGSIMRDFCKLVVSGPDFETTFSFPPSIALPASVVVLLRSTDASCRKQRAGHPSYVVPATFYHLPSRNQMLRTSGVAKTFFLPQWGADHCDPLRK